MIRPHKSKPRNAGRPTTLDLENISETGEVLDIGWNWKGDSVEFFSDWESWFTRFQEVERETKGRTERDRLFSVYAHNGAGYDWSSFFEWAIESERLENGSQYITSGSQALALNLRLEGLPRRLKLMDSSRMIPSTLAAASKAFDVKHKKVEIDVLPQDLKASDPEAYYGYMTNDVLSTAEVLETFTNEIETNFGPVGRLPMTLPALAMKLWASTLEEPILVSRQKDLVKLEEASYTGGRVECYEATIEENVNIDDRVSMYPSEMISQDFPSSYRGAWVDDYQGQGIYEVEYDQNSDNYDAMLLDHRSGQIRYRGRGVYTSAELDHFLSIGGTFTVVRGYRYLEWKPIFRNFIDKCWSIRRQAIVDGNDALAYTMKILMNSLYGKFAQNPIGWAIQLLSHDERVALIKSGVPVKVEGAMTLSLQERKVEHRFVAIASFVTAYARVALFKRMCQVKDAGGTVLYVDTDAVHSIGSDPLPTGTNLGEWDNQYQGKVVYAGPKLYATEKGVKSKGIPKDESILNMKDLERVVKKGESKVCIYSRPSSYRDVIKGKKKALKWEEQHRTIRVTAKCTWWNTG